MPKTEATRPTTWLTWERVMDATAGVPATRMSFGWSIGRSLPRLALIIGQGFEGVCGEIGGKLGRRRELRMLEELAHLRRGAPGEDNCHKGTQEGHYGRSGWLGRWHCGWIVAGPPAPHPIAYLGREWPWRGLGLGRRGWSRGSGPDNLPGESGLLGDVPQFLPIGAPRERINGGVGELGPVARQQ